MAHILKQNLIVGLLPIPILGRLITKKYIKKTKLDVDVGGGRKLNDEIDRCIGLFISEDKKSDNHYISRVRYDIVYSWLRFGAKPLEYFYYALENKPMNVRKTYVYDTYKDASCVKYSGLDSLEELKNKYIFYLKMKPYFHREACRVESELDYVEYRHFVGKHSRFIVKPLRGAQGADTCIADSPESEDASRRFFEELLSNSNSWILEELIKQSPLMSIWNESSVNTVRVISILNKKGVNLLEVWLRTGRKGMVVDNAGAGGIFCNVDPVTGIADTDGVDEYCNNYVCHPDSLVIYKGWQVPFYKELLTLEASLHKQLSQHKYLGFDFALTGSGWVLLEANWGQLVGQIPTHKGKRALFDSLMKG